MQAQNIPLTLLGGGTNVLIGDLGIRGVVCDLSPGFSYLREFPNETGAVWEVGAGCSTSRVVRRGLVRGLKGPEVLDGVPGSVGGALVMNAGGHEGELGSIVSEIWLVQAGKPAWIAKDQAGFGYRSSQFPSGTILLGAKLILKSGNRDELTIQVRNAQKKRKSSQPLQFPNAGCIFKNPPGMSAGKLIDTAGCKGWVEGKALVSPMHANFIVNQGGATASDVMRLLTRVKEHVANVHKIELELEIKLLGDFS